MEYFCNGGEGVAERKVPFKAFLAAVFKLPVLVGVDKKLPV